MAVTGILSLGERIQQERIAKHPSQSYSIRQLSKMSLRFDLVIQRNLRWTHQQKSALIESILLGYPIPPIYTIKSEDNSIWLLDGKQRLNTIFSFYRDEWELEVLRSAYGVDISGMKFSELPEEFKELIEDQMIVFYQFEKLTLDQRDELFKRLNSGTPLSSVELTRSILGTDMLNVMDQLSKAAFFQIVNMSKVQKNRFADQELILQLLGLLSGHLTDLSGKNVRRYAIWLRENGLSDNEINALREVLSYVTDAFVNIDEDVRKKVLKKNDVVGIVAAAKSVMHDVDHQAFGGRVANYILKKPLPYRETKTSGSAQEQKVRKRIELLVNEVLRP